MRTVSLILIIALAADAITGIAATISPVQNLQSNVTQGVNPSCVVAINTQTCTTSTINFSPVYSKTPLIDASIQSLSSEVPTHAITFTSTALNQITLQRPIGNSTLLLTDNESPVTVTIPSADTIIRQFAPAYGAPFPSAIVEAEGYVTRSTTSIKQTVTIRIEDVLSTVIQAIQINQLKNQTIPFAIKGFEDNPLPNIGGGFLYSITVQGPVADPNTSITVVSLRVYGITRNFQAWLNVPAALTPLYNDANYTQLFVFPATAISSVTVQMDTRIVQASIAGLSWNLTVQTSPNQVTWTSLISDHNFAFGDNQIGALVTLPTGTQYVRIVSVNGAGAGDLVALGNINITFSVPIPITINVPVGYRVSIATASATSFTLKVTFTATLTVANTVTFAWSSIGL